MKVLVINNMAPFIWGGAEELAQNLQENIISAGHDCEVVRIPFNWEPIDVVPSQMLLVRAIEVSEADHVIALKFPAYLIRHHRKTIWLLHQFRQVYDLYDGSKKKIRDGTNAKYVRRLIINADNDCLSSARHVFTNSEVTRDRLKKYNGLDSEILLPPVNNPELFENGSYGDYIFAGGRVNDLKRQSLLIQALKYTNPEVRVVIAGPPDSEKDGHHLKELANRLGVFEKVFFDLRFLPRETYASYLTRSAAVAYIPYDEDSLGYVAMEAAVAKKALITTHDSGGVKKIVRVNENGWVEAPDPQSLARCMNEVFLNKRRARDYGFNSALIWNSLNVSWPETINRLLN